MVKGRKSTCRKGSRVLIPSRANPPCLISDNDVGAFAERDGDPDIRNCKRSPS